MPKISNTDLALDLIEGYLRASIRAKQIHANAVAQGRNVTDEEIQEIRDATRIKEDALLAKFDSD